MDDLLQNVDGEEVLSQVDGFVGDLSQEEIDAALEWGDDFVSDFD